MTPERNKELEAIVDFLSASLLMGSTRIRSVQEVARVLAERAGINVIEGMSLDDWVAKRTREHVKNSAFCLEDLSPEGAARIQALLNQAADTTQKVQQDDAGSSRASVTSPSNLHLPA
jgi:hypothetical protein